MLYEAVCGFLSIPVGRDIDGLIPDPVVPEIKIDPAAYSMEEALRKVVRQCYDIRLDDQLLRQMLSQPEPDRGVYFQKLRAEYRIRREFFNTTVSLPGSAYDVSRVLQLLGCKVKQE